MNTTSTHNGQHPADARSRVNMQTTVAVSCRQLPSTHTVSIARVVIFIHCVSNCNCNINYNLIDIMIMHMAV